MVHARLTRLKYSRQTQGIFSMAVQIVDNEHFDKLQLFVLCYLQY